MATSLHQLCAAIYLVAGLVAGIGLVLPAPRLERWGVALLAAGAGVHAAWFAALHASASPPALTELPAAVSFMAWVGTLFFLALLWRARVTGLVVLVAPLAFLGVFAAALRLPGAVPAAAGSGGSWPHLHVLLASAGLSLLGVAGLAGLLFLFEHRRLKAKRPLARPLALPSLEGLDRANAVALVVGFPLLTLGVVTGMIWEASESGRLWTGTPHQMWSGVAWAVYAVLVAARFAAGQRARQAAAAAVGGFAFLLFAVIGVAIFA